MCSILFTILTRVAFQIFNSKEKQNIDAKLNNNKKLQNKNLPVNKMKKNYSLKNLKLNNFNILNLKFKKRLNERTT